MHKHCMLHGKNSNHFRLYLIYVMYVQLVYELSTCFFIRSIRHILISINKRIQLRRSGIRSKNKEGTRKQVKSRGMEESRTVRGEKEEKCKRQVSREKGSE